MSSARDRIVDATLRLIGERGLHSVTHRAVAAAAGVSPGATTYHFADKGELLSAALERFTAREVARARDLAQTVHQAQAQAQAQAHTGAGAAAADPEALLDAVTAQLRETMSHRHEQTAQLELYLQADRDPRLAPVARSCLEAYRDVIVAVLAAGGWPVAEAARLAPAVLALIDGLVLHELAAPGTGDFGVQRLKPALRALLALPDPPLPDPPLPV